MVGGSRFEILSNNAGASLGAKNRDPLEAIVGGTFDMGKDVGGYFAVNGGRKHLGKDKRKGITIATGPKIKVNVLKSSIVARSGSNLKNPFVMGPKWARNCLIRIRGL